MGSTGEVLAREIELVGSRENDHREVFQFVKEGEDYPYVDVSIVRALRNSQRVLAGAPYKIADPTAKLLRHQIRPGSTGAETSVKNLPETARESVARLLASLVFEKNQIEQLKQEEE